MQKKWIAIAAAGMLLFSSMSVQAEELPRRSLTVSGSAEVTAKSDTAAIYLSVETESAQVKNAARENAQIMTDVRNAVIAAGADASRIETQGYNVYPQNIYDDKGRVKSKKYKCTNSMKVVVSRLDKTAAVMDAAVEAGANRIDSVDFSVSKTQEYKEEALRQATAAALRKAQIMAGTLGRSVVNVISVNEDSADVTPYRVMNVRMMAGAAADAKESTPLSPGDTKLHSRVTVVFEIG